MPSVLSAAMRPLRQRRPLRLKRHFETGDFRVTLRCIVLLTGLLLPASLAEADPTTRGRIVYFDPDAAHKSILHLAAAFNEYLARRGLPLTFQPVQSRQVLEKLLRQPGTRYAFVASYYLAETGRGVLNPFLVPALKGNVSYTKVLVDLGEGEPGQLAGKSIAATVLAPDAGAAMRDLLKVLAEGGVQVSGAHGIPVSKDIDALLALTFGQVEAALVTQDSIRVLGLINPGAVTRLRTLYRSKPTLRAVLCTVEGAGETAGERDQLTRALEEMSSDALGRPAIKTMGIDGWLPFSAEMLHP